MPDMNPACNRDTYRSRGKYIAALEQALRKLIDACDRLMGDTDLHDDLSFEYRAMQEAMALLETRGVQHASDDTHSLELANKIAKMPDDEVEENIGRYFKRTQE